MSENSPREGKQVVGTHQGHLDPDARHRRALKKVRYLQNVERRREENRNRGSRS